MLLALQLPFSQGKKIADAGAQGVDTVIIGPNDGAIDVERWTKWLKPAEGTPCGIWLGASQPQDVAAAKEAGFDYVVLSLDALASSVLDEDMSYLLAAEEGLNDAMVRMLEGLPMDALVVAGGKGPWTLRWQLEVRRLVGLSRMPLFMLIEEELSSEDLESLRDVGVAAVVLDGGRKEVWPMLESLRRMIDELPPRRRGREDHMEALLPAISGVAEEEEEEDEDFD